MRDLHAHSLLRLMRRPADVRRQNDVLHGCERRILQRLFLKHVEGSAAHLTLFEPLGQSAFIDQFAAGAVHDANAFLHGLDGFRVDHSGGLWGQADVQRKVIGRGIDVFQFAHADAVLFRDACRHERIVADDLHAERAGPPRNFHADLAQSDYAQSLAAQFRSLQRFLFPFARVHQSIGARNKPCHAKHHAERQFGDCDGIGARSIHDRNPLAGSSIDVNIVHSHAGAADHAQLGGVLKQCSIYLHSRTHD